MSDNDDDITRPDMTRIEDLSEFLHKDDPEADAQLDLPSTPVEEEEAESFETMSLDDLEEDESPPAFSEDNNEEDLEESPSFQNDDEESFSNEGTQPDIEVPNFGDDSEDLEGSEDFQETSFDSTEDDNENESFGDSSSFEENADDESFSLDEMDSLDEETKLQEEVDNEIQEALEEDEEENDSESFQMKDDEDESESLEDSEFESESDFEAETTQFETAETEEEVEEENIFQTEEDPSFVTPGVQSMNSPIEDSFSQSHQKETNLQPEQRENFKDLNEFGNAISYGQVAAGGNPPFSIVLRKIKYLEDSERIIEILREHGLCNESNEADFQQGLNNGSMLISQLNEYSAIYLAHKFRRFDLEILVGLSDEVHPSKNYDMDYKGLVRKENLSQNKQETFSLEEQVIQVEAILLATTPTLENYRIDRYLGLVSAHIMIEEEEFQSLQEIDLKSKNDIDPDELLRELEQDEPDSKTSSIEIGLEEIYQNLAESLKAKAFKMKGNAVVGINYQITPLINQKPTEQSPSINYKISCTGNTVWVGGKEAPRSEA